MGTKWRNNMNAFEIVGGILMLITSVLITLLVLFQEPKGDGMSALGGGGGDSYLGKNRGRTRDAMLATITKYAAIVFFVVTIVVYALSIHLK